MGTVDWEVRGAEGRMFTITSDANNTIYACSQELAMAGGSDSDFTVRALDTMGMTQWTETFDYGPDDLPRACLPAPSGSVYVGGSGSNQNGDEDAIFLRFDGAGNLQGSDTHAGNSGGRDFCFGVALDANNQVYLLGREDTAAARDDVLLIQYSDNSPPSAVTLQPTDLDENAGMNAVVGQLDATDPDAADTHTFTLVAGMGDTDNASFTINANNELEALVSFDFETTTSASVRIRAEDPLGQSMEEALTISINDLLENAPTGIMLSNTSLAENLAVGTSVGTFVTNDMDAGDSHTYALVAGMGDADNAGFRP